MKSVANYARSVKVVVLTAAMLLAPGSALAQQEINPDPFDGDTAKVAQARPATEHRQQAASVHKKNAGAKRRQKSHANKPPGPRKVAAGSHGHA